MNHNQQTEKIHKSLSGTDILDPETHADWMISQMLEGTQVGDNNRQAIRSYLVEHFATQHQQIDILIRDRNAFYEQSLVEALQAENAHLKEVLAGKPVLQTAWEQLLAERDRLQALIAIASAVNLELESERDSLTEDFAAQQTHLQALAKSLDVIADRLAVRITGASTETKVELDTARAALDAARKAGYLEPKGVVDQMTQTFKQLLKKTP